MYNNIEAEINVNYLDLVLFRQAIEFRNNFDNYKDGLSRKDYDYYGQAVEVDSRQWAAGELKYTFETYIYTNTMLDEFYSAPD